MINWTRFGAHLIGLLAAGRLTAQTPAYPGSLVDIGGQRLHVVCAGRGSPAVVLESGTGDLSPIWSLTQPGIAAFTRVCAYDRAGYAWSDPGNTPRTFAQLSLELHTALERLDVRPPYVLVGQSYGGLVVRGFAREYPHDVVGMVLVDAAPEDHRAVYGGQPHRIRDEAKGRAFPKPRIAAGVIAATDTMSRKLSDAALPSPLDRLPLDAQRIWRWAESRPLLSSAQSAEMEWSPEEAARMHAERLINRTTLGELPLIVLARTRGGYADGMSLSADSLERERRALQTDLAALSRNGRVIFAPNSGHNIHVEDPALVINAVREVVERARVRR